MISLSGHSDIKNDSFVRNTAHAQYRTVVVFCTCGEKLWEMEEGKDSQVDPEGWIPEEDTYHVIF